MTNSDVHFGLDAAALNDLSDGEFLQAIRWNRHAPPALVASASDGDVEEFTRRLATRHGLLRRGGGKRITKLAEQRPALWSAAAFDESSRTVDLVQLWDSFGRKQQFGENGSAKSRSGRWPDSEDRLVDWLDGAAAAPVAAFELLILLEMLPAIADRLSPPVLWELWHTALAAAIGSGIRKNSEGNGASSSRRNSDEFHDDDELRLDRRLIEFGELPFVAGLVFAGVKSSAGRRRAGTGFLSQALDEITDDDGVPRADLVERLPLLLATFVRTRQWAAAFGEKPWNAATVDRLERFLQVVAPMCRADGRLALSNGESVSAVPILRAAAGGMGGKSRTSHLIAELESGLTNLRKGRAKTATRSRKKSTRKAVAPTSAKSRPALQSDESRLACLRTDWTPRAAVLVVAHAGDVPRVDLSVAGDSLLNGAWPVDVSIDGKPVELSGGWNCTCWFSDRDVDFIELQSKTAGGTIIDRQVLLSRDGEFAVFVDCIIGEAGKPLAYRSQLPAESGPPFATDTDTRELRSKRPGTTVRCYPLSLPCDRVHGAAGRLDDVDGRIQITQTTVGGLIAPVILDWSADRRKQEAEWRQLTVAADGKRVSAENAAGYRLRVGDLHLLVYRSLRNTEEPRTVLGMHTRHETVIGRFTKDGTIDPLLLVE